MNLFRLPPRFDSNLSNQKWVLDHEAAILTFIPVEWTPMADLDQKFVLYLQEEGVPIDDRSDLAMVMSSLGVLNIVETRPDFYFRRGPGLQGTNVPSTPGPLH